MMIIIIIIIIIIIMKREVISNEWESSTLKADIDLICWIKDIWN